MDTVVGQWVTQCSILPTYLSLQVFNALSHWSSLRSLVVATLTILGSHWVSSWILMGVTENQPHHSYRVQNRMSTASKTWLKISEDKIKQISSLSLVFKITYHLLFLHSLQCSLVVSLSMFLLYVSHPYVSHCSSLFLLIVLCCSFSAAFFSTHPIWFLVYISTQTVNKNVFHRITKTGEGGVLCLRRGMTMKLPGRYWED